MTLILRSEFLWKYLRATEPELGILPGAGVQNKNQEPDLSLKFWTGSGAVAVWKVAPAPGSFLDTNGFAK